jgi:3D (Asp-Asp-Asp) domain-containing protein/uncharacterized protein YabE (DUF348 family)
VWAQKDVTVIVDGHEHRVRTQAPTVAALLAEVEVEFDDDDVVTPSPDALIDSHSTVVVRHSIPVVLDLSGSIVPVDVIGDTVADALIAAGADPESNPGVDPVSSTALEPGMTIHVPDVFVRVSQDEAPVPAPVIERDNASLAAGRREVARPGRDGRKVLVYRMLVTNGVEGPAVLTAEQVVDDPEPRVIHVGTRQKPDRGGAGYAELGPPKGGRRMRVEATGYSPRQRGLSDFTATGARAKRGVIAVDPRVIPFGTRVYVPGYGYAVAADTGGAIKGNRIDLCFATVAECFAWGRRTVTITILD